jgi:protein phosphatase
VRIASGGASDVGRVRANNEDCFRIVAEKDLYVLSDGMGGEAHGEIASALAVETVVKHFLSDADGEADAKFGELHPALTGSARRLAVAVHLANQAIFESAAEHPEQRGMGATLTAATIQDSRLCIAHVGDSRAYLLRSGALQQLTSDHSLVAEQVRRGILTPVEAEESEMQSVLLRALGSQAEVEADAEEHAVFPGDVLLLCSDGLTRMATEPEIAGTLQAETDPQRAAEKLIALANDNGGADNVTVIVVRLVKESKGWLSWLRPGSQKREGSYSNARGD